MNESDNSEKDKKVEKRGGNANNRVKPKRRRQKKRQLRKRQNAGTKRMRQKRKKPAKKTMRRGKFQAQGKCIAQDRKRVAKRIQRKGKNKRRAMETESEYSFDDSETSEDSSMAPESEEQSGWSSSEGSDDYSLYFQGNSAQPHAHETQTKNNDANNFMDQEEEYAENILNNQANIPQLDSHEVSDPDGCYLTSQRGQLPAGNMSITQTNLNNNILDGCNTASCPLSIEPAKQDDEIETSTMEAVAEQPSDSSTKQNVSTDNPNASEAQSVGQNNNRNSIEDYDSNEVRRIWEGLLGTAPRRRSIWTIPSAPIPEPEPQPNLVGNGQRNHRILINGEEFLIVRIAVMISRRIDAGEVELQIEHSDQAENSENIDDLNDEQPGPLHVGNDENLENANLAAQEIAEERVEHGEPATNNENGGDCGDGAQENQEEDNHGSATIVTREDQQELHGNGNGSDIVGNNENGDESGSSGFINRNMAEGAGK